MAYIMYIRIFISQKHGKFSLNEALFDVQGIC